MIFYLSIKTDKRLTHVPHIDSIYLNIDGKSVCCTWDETDAGINNQYITYRFKGIYFDDKYANGYLKEIKSVTIDEINWQEDDNFENFDCLAISLHIDDNGLTFVYTTSKPIE